MPKNKLLKIIWKIFKISIDKAAEFDYNMSVINKTEKHQNQTIKKDEVKSMKIEVQNNIPGVKVALTNTINVYDIMNCDSFVVAKAAAEKLEEVYA